MMAVGRGLMMASFPALLGVLGLLHNARALALAGYHDVLWADPLAPPRSRAERRHLQKPCAECSMIVDLAVTRMV